MTTTEQIIFEIIAADIQARPAQVAAAVGLLDDGCTVPFVARYRKEVTGGLDDTQLRLLEERLGYLRELEKRREVILGSIRDQGKLTPELEAKIVAADTKQGLEDLYLPYRPKRRTLAAIAREAGLEPLALKLFENPGLDPETEAVAFVSPEKNVPDVKAALNGARDILAEKMSEDSVLLADMRAWLWNEGAMTSRVVEGMEETGAKFRDYFDYREPIARMPSHRALAAFRGQAEGVLTLGLEVDAERPDQPVERTAAYFNVGTQRRPADAWLWQCCRWTWRVKLRASLEAEVFDRLREAAEGAAIDVFGTNLRDLLLAAPAGHKRVLGLDPGIRTGVKTAAIDETGKLLATAVVFPFGSNERRSDAVATIARLIRQHRLTLVSIGNGTASRETKEFVEQVVRGGGGARQHGADSAGARNMNARDIKVFVVSEDGASVYSASKTAREEFPDKDVTVRGAVSIGRRLIDPLAELVKIDPKSIGVGQYQHDVDQAKLKKSLDHVVESCVNSVGVNLNTASRHLLTYVSGLGPTLAANIVDYRRDNGPFTSRAQLKKVPRLGPSKYEQCAGFLRIPGAANPLDNSAVHPESYKTVELMAKDCGCTVKELMASAEKRKAIDIRRYITDKVGLPTLTDIMREPEKPGRDPREQIEEFEFDPNVTSVDNLAEGMVLPGIVTNITNFGAFVDIGVHHDGLVHISQLADRYVSDPTQVVHLHQHVRVKVVEVDRKRNRISLSMREVMRSE